MAKKKKTKKNSNLITSSSSVPETKRKFKLIDENPKHSPVCPEDMKYVITEFKGTDGKDVRKLTLHTLAEIEAMKK